MHDIEPYYKWREVYIASEDKNSPFYGRKYDEFRFSNKIYNYLIHPQWDEIGSNTLYLKILFVDYEEGYACIELIGEWNDCISNDIMYLKREIADILYENGIYRFIIFCDNVLNFHGEDDCYYEEWFEDIIEENGWICLVNLQDHVLEEMKSVNLQRFLHIGSELNYLNWQVLRPKAIYQHLDTFLENKVKELSN